MKKQVKDTSLAAKFKRAKEDQITKEVVGQVKAVRKYPKEWGTEQFILKGFRVATEEETRRLKRITEADDLLMDIYKKQRVTAGVYKLIANYLKEKKLI